MLFHKVSKKYESEATQFIAELKQKNPQLEQQPYVYQNH